MTTTLLNDEYFMRQALKEAEYAAEKGEVPVGAIVVCQDRIIARAHNLTETLNDVTAHAEMQVITAAANILGGKYLKDCTLYVTLEPCPMCAGGLLWAQVSRVVYGADDDKKGVSLFAPSILHNKTKVTGGVMKDECAAIMTQFFANKRK